MLSTNPTTIGTPLVILIPYKDFRHKIRITKKYLNMYKIEDWEGMLYMKKRC